MTTIMMKAMALVCGIWLQIAPQGYADDVSVIVNVLSARESHAANLDLRLIEIRTPIEAGRRRGIESCRKSIALIESHFPTERHYIPNIEERIRGLQVRYKNEYQHKVCLRESREVQISAPGSSHVAGKSGTSVFYSGQWHHYFPPQPSTRRVGRLPNTGQLVINKEPTGMAPHHLLALGPTLDDSAGRSDVTSDLPQNSYSLGYVSWAQFFEILQKKHYKIELAIVNAEISRLLIHRPADSKLGPGKFRYEVDLYRNYAFCPAAFRSYQYIPPVGPKDAYFIGHANCEWKNPIEFNGLMLPSRYLSYGQQQFGIPSHTIPYAYWKVEAIPVGLVSYDIQDIQLNTTPIHPVTPSPGTHVHDEVKGINYVIGSAGEALEITANEAARELLPGFKRTSTMMILIYVAVGAAILILGFFAVHYYRLRRLV
jgi:hypothetical protein